LPQLLDLWTNKMQTRLWREDDYELRKVDMQTVDPKKFYKRLFTLEGVKIADNITDILPTEWFRVVHNYVAVILGHDKKTLLERQFITGEYSRRRNWDKVKDLVFHVDPDSLSCYTLLECRFGRSSVGLQRIFRKDPDGWKYIAVRKVIHKTWSYIENKYMEVFRFPYLLILGYKKNDSKKPDSSF